MYRRKRRSLRRKSYRRKTSYKRKSYTRKSKVVKAVRRYFETKTNQDTFVTTIFNTIDNLSCVRLLPQISQGVGHANRIGNRISPVRLTAKIHVQCNNINAIYVGASPTYFDIYIFKFKYQNEFTGSPAPADLQDFLQVDNATGAYTGAVSNGLRAVNSDMFTLKYRKRIMLANLAQATGQPAFQASINPARTITVNLTKAVKKTLIFNDNDTLITNDNLWIAVGATQTDGVQLGAGNPAGNFTLVTDLHYKDC